MTSGEKKGAGSLRPQVLQPFGETGCKGYDTKSTLPSKVLKFLPVSAGCKAPRLGAKTQDEAEMVGGLVSYRATRGNHGRE